MRDYTEEIKEQVRKRCEEIEEEQKKFLDLQRKRQREILECSAKYAKETGAKLYEGSEKRIKKQNRLQVGYFTLPIFIVLTLVNNIALYEVGVDFNITANIKIFLFNFLISVAIGVFFYFLTKAMRDRMIDLSNGLEEIAKGNLEHRLSLEKAGVLTSTYLDYNEMVQKLELYQASMKEAVEEAERANQAKSDFLSNMSHEIRTPMNAIVGMTDILLRSEMDKKQKEYLMNIKNSGAALLTIINDILDISKIESGKMEIICDNYEPMSLFNDLSMIFLNRIGEKPVDLIYDLDTSFPSGLYGDSLRIRQILINLANNAIKFTEEGSVTLKARVTEKKEDDVTLSFEIIDTGQGIKEEDIDKLFSAFTQVDSRKNHHKTGTGLGLSISKQFVELMGGEIGVSSTYGQGSNFHFTIKQKVTRWEPIPVEEGPTVVSFGSLNYGQIIEGEANSFIAPKARVLVVDDNEMNLKVARGILEPLQMNIDTAENGKEAIELVKSKVYDLVFMDHMMPVMDGVEATSIIRQIEDSYFTTLPIIALTANAVKEDRDKFFEAGMNDFVAKPIDFKEITSCIRQWLPEKKIQLIESGGEPNSQDETIGEEGDNTIILPEGLDHEAGIKAVGSRKLYIELLGDFYKLIDMKSTKIEKTLDDGLINDYTVEVHALKNTARMIGDLELSEMFKRLEELGKEGNVQELRHLTPDCLERYRSLKGILKPFAVANDCNKEEVSVSLIIEELNKLHESVDTFDLDGADSAMKLIKTYKFPYDATEDIERLDALVADVAMEDILILTDEMVKKLSER